MREVAVAGVGMTKFGNLDKSCVELFSEAALDAIAESNLKPKDIQALFIGNVYGDIAEGQANLGAFAASSIGAFNVPATRYEGACATASVAFRDAAMWVASGVYDIVLVGGVERLTCMDTPMLTRIFSMGSQAQYEGTTGITFPGIFAMMANLYASKYNIPARRLKEQMGQVAIKAHGNANLNEKAHFHKIITMADVDKSIMVASPLQLYDCCPFSDGAAAAVICEAGLARKLTKQPVYVAGMGQASAGPLCTQKDITRHRARELSVKQAYTAASMTPKDINVVELHDCFTIAEIVASECLGLFEFGTGSEAAEKGVTRIGGKIPINPSGGLKAKGHPIGATGVAQVYEITRQLRGQCGQRQVQGAKVGLTDTLGGELGTIVNIILRTK